MATGLGPAPAGSTWVTRRPAGIKISASPLFHLAKNTAGVRGLAPAPSFSTSAGAAP